jgi:lipid A 3-O-deacylase
MVHSKLAISISLFLTLAGSAFAGKEIVEAKETVVGTPFNQGKTEIQLGAGAFSSFQKTSRERQGFTDVDLVLRWGKMLYTPEGEGFFRGNLEFLVESYGAALVEGPGTGYTGLSLVLRYNFVQPDARWIPYFQIQAGGVYNDIYQDGEQRVFGRAFEYDLGSALGMRYLCTDRCGVFLEFNYRHVSNGGSADRNLGLNSLGGFLGVSYFY